MRKYWVRGTNSEESECSEDGTPWREAVGPSPHPTGKLAAVRNSRLKAGYLPAPAAIFFTMASTSLRSLSLRLDE